MKVRIFTILLLSMIIIITASCGKNLQKTIIGKWSSKDGTGIQFLKDGTAIMSADGNSIVANYNFIDKNMIKMTYNVPGWFGTSEENIIFKISFSKKELILTDLDTDMVDKFTRVK